MVDLNHIKEKLQSEPIYRIVVITVYDSHPNKWFRKDFLYISESMYKTKLKWHVATNSSKYSTCHIVGMQHTNNVWYILDTYISEKQPSNNPPPNNNILSELL
jgi:hypothetical protein